jgi:hypothetical protein
MKKLTKEQAEKMFKEEFETELNKHKNDRHAKTELWHNFTDLLCKEGYITLAKYESWSTPIFCK